MRVGWLVVALLLLNVAVGGCFGGKGKKGASDDDEQDDVQRGRAALPILTMQVQIGNDTYNFTTAPVTAAAGNASNATSNTTTTATSGNGTGNATGNQTGNGTGNATAPPSSGPFGIAPVNVTFVLGVVNGTAPFNWTFSAGDSTAPAGNGTGNATGNATSNTTTSAGPGGNTTGNATNPVPGVTLGNTTNATVTHTYTMVGNYTATFALTLPNATRVTLNAIVLVAAGAGNTTVEAAPPQEPQHFEGSVTCAPAVVVDSEQGGSAVDHTIDVLEGQTLMTLTLDYEEATGLEDLDFEVTDPAGDTEAAAAGGPEPPMEIKDPMPGTWSINVIGFSCVGELDYTFDAVFGEA